MEGDIKISVIIPVYNAEKYLKQCLDSLFTQTFQNFEAIAVDDGSLDASPSLLQEYAEREHRLHVFTKEHSNAGEARNLGLEHARGKYLAFLDADDFVDPQFLWKAYSEAQEKDADIVAFRCNQYDEPSGFFLECPWTLHTWEMPEHRPFPAQDAAEKIFNMGSCVPWDKLFKRSFIVENNIRFQSNESCNNMLFTYAAQALAGRISTIEDILYHQRIGHPKPLAKDIEYLTSCSYKALKALQSFLVEHGIYEIFKKSFVNRAVDFSLSNLHNFHDVFHALIRQQLKREWLKSLDISETPETDFYVREQYEEMRALVAEREEELKQIAENPLTQPKVSIIIPIYNVSQYLRLCLDSAVNQTLEAIEIIAVNDGSTDDCLDIINEYAAKDPRIVVITGPNGGYGRAMNQGLDRATGEYIGIIEPDDFVDVRMFDELYSTAVENDVDFVKSDFYRFTHDNEGNIVPSYNGVAKSKKYYDTVQSPYEDLFLFRFVKNTWSGLYKSLFIEKYHIRHNETPGASFQDNGFWFQTFIYAEKAYFLNKPFYYNRRDNLESSVYDSSKIWCISDEYAFIRDIISRDTELFQHYIGVFHVCKYRDYIFTLNLINDEQKPIYLEKFAKEYNEAIENKEIDQNLFLEKEWECLQWIVKDPTSVCEALLRKTPLISVIVPVYDSEQYLSECLDSVLSQTLKNIEVICINDGSTDHSLDLLNKYAESDERIIIINQSNLGAGVARNNGISCAKGEFLAFMDSDDWYPQKDILENLYIAARNNNVMICGGSFSAYKNGEVVDKYSGDYTHYTFKKNEMISYKDYQFDYGYHRFIYNTEFIKKKNILFPPYLRYHDLPFFANAMIHAEHFYAIKQVVYRHREYDNQSAYVKVNDIIRSIIDNLRYSKRHKLAYLHYLNYNRLNEYFRKIATYSSSYFNIDNIELLILLNVAYYNLDLELLNEYHGIENLKYYIEPLQKFYRNIHFIDHIKISVIIPVFNAEKHINQTLESVLKQSLKDIEVICVDDGSTDGSLEIIKKFEKKDSRIRVVCQQNLHAGVARNTGLLEARGEYVHFLDADDYVLDYAYESIYNKAKRYDLDCLKFCGIAFDELQKITVDNKHYLHSELREGDFNRLLPLNDEDTRYKLCVTPWTGLYRRRWLQENSIQFNDLFCCNDRSFFCHVITTAPRLMVARDRLVVHRVCMEDSLIAKRASNFYCNLQSAKIIEEQLLSNKINTHIFENIMKQEFHDILVWCNKLYADREYGNAIVEQTEKFLNQFNYRFMRDIRKEFQKIKTSSIQYFEQYKLIGKGTIIDGNKLKAPKPTLSNNKIDIFFEECSSPKVSVIIPIYNQEEYLNEALNSLTTQTLKEMEFICINDGSTDNSMTILNEYANIDKRIKIVDKENTGYGHSMNIGIDMARGEYLGILEPDDFVLKDMFKKLYDIASKNKLDLVKADFNRFWIAEDGSTKKMLFRLSSDKSWYNRLVNTSKELGAFKLVMNTWSGIYSTAFLNRWHIRHNETPGASFQDNGFWFQTFCHAQRAWFIDTPLYMNRRDNPNSSVRDKGKMYAITNEYKYIWDKLSVNQDFASKYEAIFWQKKWSNSLVTYYRLRSDSKNEYLHHLYEEFRPALLEGKLDKTLFLPLQWKILNQIVEDPDAFNNVIRVSVIIPAYNAEAYVGQCLDSILSREEINFEVICVDDGSTDNTLAILREYEAKDRRVHVMTQENAGAGAARNNGMRQAKGEYLAFLDADDFFEPEMLRSAWEKAYLDESDIVVFRSDNYIEELHQYTGNSATIKKDLLPVSEPFAGNEIREDIFKVFIGWPWDKIFRTEFVRNNALKFQEQRTTNDLLFVFSAIVKAERISTLDKILAHHRRLKEGQSLSVSREKSWDCFYRALRALRKQLQDWRVYERFEQDFVNYSLHACLWNINSLVGEAYADLYETFKNSLVYEFHIVEHDELYFYNKEEYELYLMIMQLDKDSYTSFYKKHILAKLSKINSDYTKTKYDLNKIKSELNSIKANLNKK